MPPHVTSSKGFKRTASLLRADIRRASETRGFSESRVLTHWEEIVGAETAAIARPVEVSYGRGGFGATLTVLTTGAQAPMLEMQKEKLREKVNAVYGYNAISRLRITQTAPTGFAEGRVDFQHRAKDDSPKTPDPETTRAAQDLAKGVGDEKLRHALEALAQNVLTKTKR